MADFNIRTDAVDVEQIMRQIRARIQEKRGVDYTEQQIQELASVKLERFLDPKGVRSDLVEQFRKARDRRLEPFHPDQYDVDANALFGSPRVVLRVIRKILNPILKLFISAPTLVQVLHKQSEMNKLYEKQLHMLRDKTQQRDEVDVLYYELVHNLVLELTRVGIENRNLKMRLESLSSRLDFDERRARALEGVVQFRPGTGPSREPVQAQPPRPSFVQPRPEPATPAHVSADGSAQEVAVAGEPGSESGTARRRRRRRRGRRGGRGRPGEPGAMGTAPASASLDESSTPPHGDPTADAALDDDGGADAEPEGDMGPDDGPDSPPQ